VSGSNSWIFSSGTRSSSMSPGGHGTPSRRSRRCHDRRNWRGSALRCRGTRRPRPWRSRRPWRRRVDREPDAPADSGDERAAVAPIDSRNCGGMGMVTLGAVRVMLSPLPPTSTEMKFIAGLPMKPATKRLIAGRTAPEGANLLQRSLVHDRDNACPSSWLLSGRGSRTRRWC